MKLLKKLLIIIPVVAGLILVSIFMPAQQVSIEGIGTLSFETKVTISVGSDVAYASPGWVSPTSHVEGDWDFEINAYDENTGTSASYDAAGASWTPYLELTHTAVDCDKVQVWVSAENGNMAQVEVDVYYSDAWDNIYSGAPTFDAFAEYAIGSQQSVTAMRIRCLNSHGVQPRFQYVHEADFNDAGLVPDITNLPIEKAFGFVAESSSYWSTVTNPPAWPLDDTECFFTVTNSSGAAVDIAIRAINFGGGVGWTLAPSPAENTVTLKAGKSGDSLETNMVTLTTDNQSFITGLADATSKKWEIKLETGTFTDGVGKSSTITLTATLA